MVNFFGHKLLKLIVPQDIIWSHTAPLLCCFLDSTQKVQSYPDESTHEFGLNSVRLPVACDRFHHPKLVLGLELCLLDSGKVGGARYAVLPNVRQYSSDGFLTIPRA